MINRATVAFVAAFWLVAATQAPAQAENAMGYQLLSAQEAASLPHNRGALGLDVERAQAITDSSMAFELIRVKQVHRGSAGAEAGFKPGDQIIALNGRVFPSLAAFAAYVGSLSRGTQVTVDYIPAGGGPAQAQRVPVTVGGSAQSKGLSTGSKIAIGAGAAALFGCYELGCFSHRGNSQAQSPNTRPSNPQLQ